MGTEMAWTGLALADTGTLAFAYKGMTGVVAEAKAGLGIRKANCPSVAGTSWNPPKTLGETASDGLSLGPIEALFMGKVEGSCT